MAYNQCYHYDGFMTWIAYSPSDIHNVGVDSDTMPLTEATVQPLEALNSLMLLPHRQKQLLGR